MSFQRKFKRKNILEKRKDNQQKIDTFFELYDKMPKKCLTCNKEFDTKDKEYAKQWIVKVFSEEKTVELYCPECGGKDE